jgi:ribonuclease HII
MGKPNFRFERELWKKDYKLVAGVDEVGRGSFAGPVVAGCVVFAPSSHIPQDIRVDDSKKLTPRQREKAEVWIKKNVLAWGVGEASTSLINRIGMGKATKVAFRKAIKSTNSKLDFLLIDAFYIPYVAGLRRKNQKAIIDGDEKSITIGAASIIAKVYRDKLMKKLARKYPKYGWGRNKGYGTRQHLTAIRKYGITRYHRKVFVRTFLNNFASSRAQ